MDVLLEVLTHPPHVALSINDSRALEDDIIRADNPQESFVLGVKLVPLRHKKCAVQLERQVRHVVTSDRQGGEREACRDFHDSIIVVGRVSCQDGIVEGFLVDRLNFLSYVIDNGAKIQDAVCHCCGKEGS